MISEEQIDRVESELSAAAFDAFNQAKQAERALEDYTYPRSTYQRQQYSPAKREKLLVEFREADYLAESRAWVTSLIRASKVKSGVPHDALCFFRDGARWCCVNGDFVNLQESPAGFGDNIEQAMEDLQNKWPRHAVPESQSAEEAAKSCDGNLQGSLESECE